MIFFNNFREFDDPFNAQLANKLFWCIDELIGLTRAQSTSFNSKVTSTVCKFNEKNQTAFWLPVRNSVIVTSNDRNPMYLGPEDRRQLYWRVSPAFKQNRPFFRKVRANLADYNCMHNMFMELAQRKLTDENGVLWEPTSKNDPFQDETNLQKADSMKHSFTFVIEFFNEPTWYTRYNFSTFDWESETEIIVTTKRHHTPSVGAVRIRITKGRLYYLYKQFLKDKFPGARPIFEKTFFHQMEELGIETGARQLIHGVQLACSDIYYSVVKRNLLKLFPGFDFPVWPTEIDQELRVMLGTQKPKKLG